MRTPATVSDWTANDRPVPLPGGAAAAV